MTIDHIFIFTQPEGKVANQLVDFGLKEGRSRVHNGQGTTNRKFYFNNFFLEVLWVHDESEILSKNVEATGLWKRANATTFSPFGLCLVNNDASDPLFIKAFKHQPAYFPPKNFIEIINHQSNPSLPWTFRLPFKGPKNNNNEPTNHNNGIRTLTRTIFEYVDDDTENFTNHFYTSENLQFSQSTRNWLRLIFDNKKQGKSRDFDSLRLTVEY